MSTAYPKKNALSTPPHAAPRELGAADVDWLPPSCSFQSLQSSVPEKARLIPWIESAVELVPVSSREHHLSQMLTMCWNMNPNIYPKKITQFCRFLYTSTMVRIWVLMSIFCSDQKWES